MSRTSFHRASEADLFPSQIVENSRFVLFQFRIKTAVVYDYRFSNLRQEGLFEPDLGAKARRTADDHTGNIVAPAVAGHDAISNEERRRTSVIADDAIGREVRLHFFFGMTRQGTQHIQRTGEEIGLIVRVDALQHRHDALKAHA